MVKVKHFGDFPHWRTRFHLQSIAEQRVELENGQTWISAAQTEAPLNLQTLETKSRIQMVLRLCVT